MFQSHRHCVLLLTPGESPFVDTLVQERYLDQLFPRPTHTAIDNNSQQKLVVVQTDQIRKHYPLIVVKPTRYTLRFTTLCDGS